jgi:hypothetical protein
VIYPILTQNESIHIIICTKSKKITKAATCATRTQQQKELANLTSFPQAETLERVYHDACTHNLASLDTGVVSRLLIPGSYQELAEYTTAPPVPYEAYWIDERILNEIL